MADKQNEKRYHKARDVGDRAGQKAKTVLAAIAAIAIGIAAFGGQILPFLAAGALQLIGLLGLSVSIAAVAIASTIKKSSDEPKERVAWFIAIVLLVTAFFYFIGNI